MTDSAMDYDIPLLYFYEIYIYFEKKWYCFKKYGVKKNLNELYTVYVSMFSMFAMSLKHDTIFT